MGWGFWWAEQWHPLKGTWELLAVSHPIWPRPAEFKYLKVHNVTLGLEQRDCSLAGLELGCLPSVPLICPQVLACLSTGQGVLHWCEVGTSASVSCCVWSKGWTGLGSTGMGHRACSAGADVFFLQMTDFNIDE